MVQFVKFQKFMKHGSDPAKLSAKVLKEIPDQFVDYVVYHNIKP